LYTCFALTGLAKFIQHCFSPGSQSFIAIRPPFKVRSHQ
jgi:hypothetical protein